MGRYYLHLHDGTDVLLDEEGQQFPDVTALQASVLACARSIIGSDANDGVIDLRHRIDVEDEAGSVIYSLAFRDAVHLVAP